MPDDSPRKTRQLVLVGGGHAHVAVLKAFGMSPLPEARIILVSSHWDTPYSGMLPALIAGHYTREEIHVDLHRLARYAGAEFCRDRVTGLDLKAKKVLLAGRPPLHFDFLSLNTGSTPSLNEVPGAAEHALAVKPIDQLLAGLARLEEQIAAHGNQPFRVVTVGGGAGGVELTLSLHHRLAGRLPDAKIDFELITASPELLSSHNRGVRRRLAETLTARGIQTRTGTRVTSVTAREVHCDTGAVVPFDALLWATDAAAPDWPGASGLKVTGAGFVAVDRFLRSPSHEFVFAAGDVAGMIDAPRPKSGVFAVRQGPPLANNLRMVMMGFNPRAYRPQRSFLSLVSTGDRNAIASKGPWSAAGGWVWNWKQRIDRKWMRLYRDLPKVDATQAEMDFTARMKANLKTTDRGMAEDQRKTRCGGAGAKIGGLVLHEALRLIQQPASPAVLVGLATPDDAAVFTAPPGRALVQSVDFFRLIANDPHLFGRIAAIHALNNLFAKGATPLAAVATVTLPPANDRILIDQLAHLLAGAAGELNACHATLVGGHSAEGKELALGLTVTGTVPTTRVMRKSGLQAGDALVLTKPLGTGVLFAADVENKLSASQFSQAVEGMLRPGAAAAEIFLRAGVRACTDVGGFGLLGHLREMLSHAPVRVELQSANIPAYPGAREFLAQGIFSTMQSANAYHLGLLGSGSPTPTPETALLLDPQTAGGLLAGVPHDQAEAVIAELHAGGYRDAAIIGRAIEAGAGPQVVLGTQG